MNQREWSEKRWGEYCGHSREAKILFRHAGNMEGPQMYVAVGKGDFPALVQLVRPGCTPHWP